MSKYLFHNLPQGWRLNNLPWGWISGPQILKNEDELVLAFKPSVLSHSQDSIYYPHLLMLGPQFVFWKDSGNKNVQNKKFVKKINKNTMNFFWPPLERFVEILLLSQSKALFLEVVFVLTKVRQVNNLLLWTFSFFLDILFPSANPRVVLFRWIELKQFTVMVLILTPLPSSNLLDLCWLWTLHLSL